MSPDSTLDPKQALSLAILQGKVIKAAKYGYKSDGTK